MHTFRSERRGSHSVFIVGFDCGKNDWRILFEFRDPRKAVEMVSCLNGGKFAYPLQDDLDTPEEMQKDY